MNLITSKAYNFKLSLKDFWTFNDKILAEDFLRKWYYWATHSQIEPIIDAAKTIKSHWMGIINYAETKISNGVLEGINSMVQSAKSSARGFRTTKNLILIIYLRLGKLQFNLPTQNSEEPSRSLHVETELSGQYRIVSFLFKIGFL
jgi:transposase